jgi:DtxR family transcriptional regulator, Mn-dependent transcriptional regulator
MSKRTIGRRELTTSQQDYLKALFHLGGADASVAGTKLADRLNVSPASATQMVGKLAALGLVVTDRYHGTQLTPEGFSMAVEMVRHHRLLEMFLVQKLGYAWDEVHEEAERLEHVISERLEQRIFEVLGEPDLDPHGDPIPSLSGEIADTDYRRLADTREGEKVAVKRVSDSDPGKLRALDRIGLRLGTNLEVVAESEYESPVEVMIAGRRRQVPLGIARVVYVK